MSWLKLHNLPVFDQIDDAGLETLMECFSGEWLELSAGETYSGDGQHAVCLVDGMVSGLELGRIVSAKNAFTAKRDSLVLLMETHMLGFPCYGCCFFHARLLDTMGKMNMDIRSLYQ